MDSEKKESRYRRVYEQLEGLMSKTSDPVARMATISSVLSHKFGYYFWCGFYRVIGDELIVGPYQGPLACQVLKGGGVCWAGVNEAKSIVVPDVHQFPGHIACDSRSNSEIVVPVFNQENQLVAVLDVDSTSFSAFDDTDRIYLEKITSLIYREI
jgi:GAF domain-containing protein